MTRNVTEIQRRLIDLGFLARGEDDGKFGARSMEAYNRFLANQGKPPHQGMILLSELNAELFPSEQPAPAPKRNTVFGRLLVSLVLRAILPNLKGLPMNNVLVDIKSAWASKLNWTLAVGVVFNVFMLFGHPVPDDIQAQVYSIGNGAVLVVGWLIKNFFTTSITPASAKKLQ